MKARTARRANIDQLARVRAACVVLMDYFDTGYPDDMELVYELKLQVRLIDWRIGHSAARHS